MTQQFPVVDVLQRPILVDSYLIYRPGGGATIRVGKVLEIIEKPIVLGPPPVTPTQWQYHFKTISVDLSALSFTWTPSVAPPGTDFTYWKTYHKATKSKWEAGSAGPSCGWVNIHHALCGNATLCTDPDLIKAFEDWIA